MKFIAIDWDDTFTADPELWRQFVKNAHERKHRCFIVTARGEDQSEEVKAEAKSLGVEAIFCAAAPKIRFTEEMGISIDIWIDDMPELLFEKYER